MNHEQTLMAEAMQAELSQLKAEQLLEAGINNPLAAVLVGTSVSVGMGMSGLSASRPEDIRTAALVLIGSGLGALVKVRQESQPQFQVDTNPLEALLKRPRG